MAIGPQRAESEAGAYFERDDLAGYLSECNPEDVEIPWPVGPLYLFSAADLDAGQAGYRWNSRDPARKKLTDWPETWIVLGSISGDAVILDTQDGSVSLAPHGGGKWQPRKVARNLREFLQVLECWIRLYVIRFRKVILIVNPQFQEALREECAKVTGAEEVASLLWHVTH